MAINLDLLKLLQLNTDSATDLYLKTDSSGNVVVGNIDDIVKNTEDVLTLTNTASTGEQDWTLSVGSGTQHAQGSFAIQAGDVPNSANTVFRATTTTAVQLATNLTNIGTTTFNISGDPGGAATTGTSITLNHGGVSKGVAIPTSGNLTIVDIAGGTNQSFEPTSGTATYTNLEISPTINQTGGANGITRAIHINPTLTSAADFRAIDVEAGEVLISSSFKYVDGNEADQAVLISDAAGVASWASISFASTVDFRYDSNLDVIATMFFRGPVNTIEFYPAYEIDSNNLTLDAKLDADASWTNISTSVNATTAASDLQNWIDVTAPVTTSSLWRVRITVLYKITETAESSVLMKYIA